MKNKTLVIFDFDCTITKRDTLLSFLIFSQKTSVLIAGFIKLIPVILFYIFGIIDNHIAKEKVLSRFFKGWHVSDFNSFAESFKFRIDAQVRKDALNAICHHKKQGHELIIISASPENWIQPWANKMGFRRVIATKLESDHSGRLTGNLYSHNCYGPEKVKRLIEEYKILNNYFIIVYGDSNGDKELLDLADEGYFKKF